MTITRAPGLDRPFRLEPHEGGDDQELRPRPYPAPLADVVDDCPHGRNREGLDCVERQELEPLYLAHVGPPLLFVVVLVALAFDLDLDVLRLRNQADLYPVSRVRRLAVLVH